MRCRIGKSLTDLPLPLYPSCPSPAKKGFCTREKGIEAPLNQPFPLLSTLPPIYTTAGFPYTTGGAAKNIPPFPLLLFFAIYIHHRKSLLQQEAEREGNYTSKVKTRLIGFFYFPWQFFTLFSLFRVLSERKFFWGGEHFLDSGLTSVAFFKGGP